MYSYTYSKSTDRPDKVVNDPARGHLNREMHISLSAFVPENMVSRYGFGSPVPRQPVILLNQAESGACLWDFSQVPRRRPFICLKPPYAIESVPSLSGPAITDDVHCRESAGTGPVNLKVVPNKSCLGRSPWTN